MSRLVKFLSAVLSAVIGWVRRANLYGVPTCGEPEMVSTVTYKLWVACSKGGRCTDSGLHDTWTCEAENDRRAVQELIASAHSLLGFYDRVQCTITVDGREVTKQTITL